MDNFDQELIKIIELKNPKTFEEAVNIVSLMFLKDPADIKERLLHLELEGKLSFDEANTIAIPSFRKYIFSNKQSWFWVNSCLALITSVLVLIIPPEVFPLVYVRYLFTFLMMLFLPGYSLIRALFDRAKLSAIELATFSLGLSLVFLFAIGLLLNFTPFGISVVPITMCLLCLVVIFSIIAVVKDYVLQKKVVI